jgi:hypothetical protein
LGQLHPGNAAALRDYIPLDENSSRACIQIQNISTGSPDAGEIKFIICPA